MWTPRDRFWEKFKWHKILVYFVATICFLPNFLRKRKVADDISHLLENGKILFVSSLVMNYNNLMLIGAGINGSWAALQLARRGAKVILLEKVHFISVFKIVSDLLSVVCLSEFLVPSKRCVVSVCKNNWFAFCICPHNRVVFYKNVQIYCNKVNALPECLLNNPW